jgi:tRNA threonylcarbamoyl adenosine modification protein YeaZ
MILLIDTASSILRLAIGDRERGILDEVEFAATPEERGVHDAKLASQVEQLLREHGTIRDLHRIGLIIGPGSFTGLRIGLSFVKGVVMALHTEVVPLTVHEVLSCALAGKEVDLIAIPAYQQRLAYVCDRTSPREIRLMEVSELSGSAVAGIASVLPASTSFTPISFELKHMLGLTVNGKAVTDLKDLEPMYVTDFLPGKGSL